MSCVICRQSFRASIIKTWAITGSLRRAASVYGVSYRTLARHINECLADAWRDYEERFFQSELNKATDYLTYYFTKKMKRRPRSIIKQPVKFTWSRRAWKPKNREITGKGSRVLSQIPERKQPRNLQILENKRVAEKTRRNNSGNMYIFQNSRE